ncbi:hypothetical protein [Chryseobacterium gleum]|uniref:hypothetical protein n=1 Tax=Chryseobacterium gleum TaxID=250 RepID=UPI00289B1FD1|nr:hypothetical protein [Chryseobacterium gleum]
MKYRQNKKSKYKTSVTSFYHEGFNWKVVVPTSIYNYLLEKLEEYPPFKGFKIDIALYYLSLIISIPASYKDKVYLWGFVPLDSRELKKKNYLYKQYFKYFLDIDILETASYATNSHRATGYRYNFKAIKSEGVECVDFMTFEIRNKKFNDKILNENICNDSFASCPHLCKWLNADLYVDFDSLKSSLQSDFCYNKYSLTYQRLNPIMSKAYNYWFSALMLQEHCFRTSRNPFTDNRLHTNFTNMPSKLRPFISYKGENIVSLDIKNSQPYFMVLLLERFNNVRIRNIISNVYNKSNMGIMLQKLKETTSSKEFQEEFSIVKEWILTGIFYEELENLFPDIVPNNVGKFRKFFYNGDKEISELKIYDNKRDLMKKVTLQILYTPLTKPSKEYQIFKKHFPLLCSCIEIFKTQLSYKQFPQLLQHIEADCILNIVTVELAKQYPEMPLWTIHDSICTTVSWFKIMKETVQELFLSYCEGVIPSFKVEHWSNELLNVS